MLAATDLDAGGMGEVVALLARGLPRLGIDITVLHALVEDHPHGDRLARRLIDEGITVVSADRTDGTRWIREHRPDIVSGHIAPDWVIDAAAAATIPFVDTLHFDAHTLRSWSEEVARAERLDAIVAVSEGLRQQYLRGNPGFDADRIVTIPNCVASDRMAAVDRTQARAWLGLDDEVLLVSLARHSLQKNSYGLVTAFAEVAADRPAAHLLVAGRVDDDLYARQVRQLRDGLSCRDQIHLRDHTPQAAAVLAAADAFVLDSFFEGWPLAPMEALCSGLPVVISDVFGASELMAGEPRRGHLVPNPLGDPFEVTWEAIRTARFAQQVNQEELTTALRSMIDDRDEWSAGRADRAASCRADFAEDACLQRHAGVLRGVSAGRRAADALATALP